MVFFGSRPNPHSHKSPRRQTRAHTHKHTHLWSGADKSIHVSLYRLVFWPRGVHVNSRGKTVTDFQDLLQVQVTSSGRDGAGAEVWSFIQSLTYTLTHLWDFGGHIRASSITCGWPRIRIKPDVKFTQPLWNSALLILAITLSVSL